MVFKILFKKIHIGEKFRPMSMQVTVCGILNKVPYGSGMEKEESTIGRLQEAKPLFRNNPSQSVRDPEH